MKMKNTLLLVILFFSAFLLNADELWEKAVQYADSNQNLIAGRFEMELEIEGRGEKPFMTMSFKKESELNDSGEVIDRILSASRNGKDITEKMKKGSFHHKKDSEKKTKKVDESVGPESLLFLTSNKESVTYEALGKSQEIRNRVCDEYLFTMMGINQELEEVKYWGSVFIDQITGVAMSLTYQMTPPPARMIEMNYRFDYYYSDSGMLQTVKMDSDGILKFFLSKKKVTTHIISGNFFNKS